MENQLLETLNNAIEKGMENLPIIATKIISELEIYYFTLFIENIISVIIFTSLLYFSSSFFTKNAKLANEKETAEVLAKTFISGIVSIVIAIIILANIFNTFQYFAKWISPLGAAIDKGLK